MTLRRSLPLAAVVAIAMALPSTALADKATAQALFKEGSDLVQAGKYADACVKFAASNAEDRSVGALTGLGVCNEKLGKLATAWASFSEAATLARSLKDDRHQGLLDRAAGLEPKLSKLTLVVKGTLPEGAVVKRNGVEVSKNALGNANPVDPGEHEIEVTAESYKTWKGSIKVGPNGDKQSFDVPEMVKDPDWKPKEGPGGAGGKVDDGTTLRIAGFVLGGVGVAALGVGAVMGGLAASDKSNLDTDPLLCQGGTCSDTGRALVEDAKTKALVSTILIPVGGAMLAGGVVMLVVGTMQKNKAAQQKIGRVDNRTRQGAMADTLRASPWVSGQSGGVVVMGKF